MNRKKKSNHKTIPPMSAAAWTTALLTAILVLMPAGLLRATDVEFPLVQSLAIFPYNDHHLLEKGDFSLSLSIANSNIYTYDVPRTNINDMELLSQTLSLRYGLGDRLEFLMIEEFPPMDTAPDVTFSLRFILFPGKNRD